MLEKCTITNGSVERNKLKSWTREIRFNDGSSLKIFIRAGCVEAFSSIAWPSEIHLLIYFHLRHPLVFFEPPAISKMPKSIVSVGSSSSGSFPFLGGESL